MVVVADDSCSDDCRNVVERSRPLRELKLLHSISTCYPNSRPNAVGRRNP